MKNVKPLSNNTLPTELQTLASLDLLKDTFTDISTLRQSLTALQQAGLHLMPNTRRLTVQPVFRRTREDPYNFIPGITLCGRWLSNAGFKCCQPINVIPLSRLIIILPENPPPARDKPKAQRRLE